MLTSDYDYDLPEELIAQHPLPRGESRLLILHKSTGKIEHRMFPDILEYLAPNDLMILNDTRVSGRRFIAKRNGGGAAEVFLLSQLNETTWKSLVRPGSKLRDGATVVLDFGDKMAAVEIISTTDDGGRIVQFQNLEDAQVAGTRGHIPLPPYIHTALLDEERYQTIYSRQNGSAAAPTAGLHFTDEVLKSVQAIGVELATVTLNVGIDTFRPVKVDDPANHVMHGESYDIPHTTVAAVGDCPGKIVCVGTTTVRATESGASSYRELRAGPAETNLFITPGYSFKVADAILTNFHQPKSTLLMMVSAFAELGNIKEAYHEAIENNYRFFSFGDAMLII
ncbi:MAG: tRNA preQ1(34) S-adenosylmethionine ribosyltransferase-isomerase QueA [Chthonomonadales bacterium]